MVLPRKTLKLSDIPTPSRVPSPESGVDIDPMHTMVSDVIEFNLMLEQPGYDVKVQKDNSVYKGNLVSFNGKML